LDAANSTIQSLRNKDLTIGGDTSGNVVVRGDSTSNFQVVFTAAPALDMAVISNTGQGTTTNGVDGLVVNFANAGSSFQQNSGINVVVTSGNTNTATILDGIVVATISAQANATERALVIGTGWDKGIVIMSGGGTNSGLTYEGSGRPTKTITLSPEYSGGVITVFYGAGTDTSTTGNMTSDVETTEANSLRTYYQWERTQGTLHYNTVAVRVRLPADFDAWATANALVVNFVTDTTGTTSNVFDAYVYLESEDASAVASDTGNAAASADTWETVSIDDSTLDDGSAPEWDAAGETAIIYLRMGSASGEHVRIGDIQLNYLAKF
jgi:hypothetical protein